MRESLPLVTKAAQRRRGSEWYACGIPEPRRDRAAARRWCDSIGGDEKYNKRIASTSAPALHIIISKTVSK